MKPIIGLSLLLLSAPLLAGEIQYKCLVETNQGPQVVEVVSEHSDVSKLGQSILGSKIYAADGVSQIAVVNVRECVLFDEEFVSPQAQELESKFPR